MFVNAPKYLAGPLPLAPIIRYIQLNPVSGKVVSGTSLLNSRYTLLENNLEFKSSLYKFTRETKNLEIWGMKSFLNKVHGPQQGIWLNNMEFVLNVICVK